MTNVKNFIILFILLSIGFINPTKADTTFKSKECTMSKIKFDIKKLISFEHDKVYYFFAKYIHKYSKLYNIHCEIPTLLLRVESRYTIKHNKLSGEISIAQINYDYWAPKYPKLFKRKLSKKKLLSSNLYAIKNMFLILDYIKRTYRKRDNLWFLRYNSNLRIHRLAYLKKFESFLYKISGNRNVLDYQEKGNLLRSSVKTYGWKKVINVYTSLDKKSIEQKEYTEKVKRWRKNREANYKK